MIISSLLNSSPSPSVAFSVAAALASAASDAVIGLSRSPSEEDRPLLRRRPGGRCRRPPILILPTFSPLPRSNYQRRRFSAAASSSSERPRWSPPRRPGLTDSRTAHPRVRRGSGGSSGGSSGRRRGKTTIMRRRRIRISFLTDVEGDADNLYLSS